MLESGCIYHVYNRGNNGQKIFFSDENYLFFLRKTKQEITPVCDVLAYCLMPNHYHILLRIPDDRIQHEGKMDPVKRKIGTLQSSYTRAINKSYNRTGSLFQQKVKSRKLETEEEQLICFHYIHQNPLKAKLEEFMGDWPYSSYLEYSGQRNGKLPNRDVAKEYIQIPNNPADFIIQSKQVISAVVLKQLNNLD